MFVYRNKKTGIVLTVPCKLSGPDLEPAGNMQEEKKTDEKPKGKKPTNKKAVK